MDDRGESEAGPYRPLVALGERRVARIEYGPFPRSWQGAAAPFAVALAVAAGLAIIGGRSQTVRCQRGPEEVHCSVTDRVFLVPVHSYSFRALGDADNARYVDDGGFGEGYTVIRALPRQRFELLASEGADGARAGEALHRFFGGDDARIEVATRPSILAFLGVLAALAAAGVILWVVRREPDDVELEADLDRELLRVRERRGGKVRRSRELSLAGVTAVRLAVSERSLLMQSPRPAGFITLVIDDGSFRPLAPRPLFGGRCHWRAAAALAKALGVEVERLES